MSRQITYAPSIDHSPSITLSGSRRDHNGFHFEVEFSGFVLIAVNAANSRTGSAMVTSGRSFSWRPRALPFFKLHTKINLNAAIGRISESSKIQWKFGVLAIANDTNSKFRQFTVCVMLESFHAEMQHLLNDVFSDFIFQSPPLRLQRTLS
jgi:hypothetical protein